MLSITFFISISVLFVVFLGCLYINFQLIGYVLKTVLKTFTKRPKRIAQRTAMKGAAPIDSAASDMLYEADDDLASKRTHI